MAQAQGPSNTKRQVRGDTSRHEILGAARRLIEAHGYDGMTISALASQSGLPPSSIYWHFSSKEGVLLEFLRSTADYYTVAPVSMDRDELPRERLKRRMRATAEAIVAHPVFLRNQLLLQLQDHDLDAVASELICSRQLGRDALAGALAQAYDAQPQPVRELLVARLTDLGLAMCDGAFVTLQFEDGDYYVGLIEQIADALSLLADQIIAAAK
jgi:AcrR family transcriptional regulator